MIARGKIVDTSARFPFSQAALERDRSQLRPLSDSALPLGEQLQAGLQVRRRRRKRLTRGERVPLPTPTHRGERWSMDFALDTLADGRAFER
jgi:hypothetical protein